MLRWFCLHTNWRASHFEKWTHRWSYSERWGKAICCRCGKVGDCRETGTLNWVTGEVETISRNAYLG